MPREAVAFLCVCAVFVVFFLARITSILWGIRYAVVTLVEIANMRNR